MEFNREHLEHVAKVGSQKVADAFSKFSKSLVQIHISDVRVVPLRDSLIRIQSAEEHTVVAYTQLLFGASGASFLLLSREDALVLVDLLNQRSAGSTDVLRDIDRSAIKEILNILANAYMTTLGHTLGRRFGLGVPVMITVRWLSDILQILMEKSSYKNDSTIIFESVFIITQHHVNVTLYLIFNERLGDFL